MKDTNQSQRDPVLKDLLGQIAPPELSEGFSKRVMNSVRLNPSVSLRHKLIIPKSIKIGVPVFLAICALLFIIIPADQNISNPGFLNFIDQISRDIQTLSLPEFQIPKKILYYFVGAIGLIWMFVLSESMTRRFKKS